ncbi:hypothetical protein ABT117_19550 [Streptomyces sp. NPDC002262]|uniref:hypothetical protein n=1 Tax=Streptomyces sp. NPDC002262 TaxID=3154414 RepID=UPI00331C09E1
MAASATDESVEAGWFSMDTLPAMSDRMRESIATVEKEEAAASFAPALQPRRPSSRSMKSRNAGSMTARCGRAAGVRRVTREHNLHQFAGGRQKGVRKDWWTGGRDVNVDPFPKSARSER